MEAIEIQKDSGFGTAPAAGYEDTGSGFGINIHRGSYNGTSSEGCQTIHPDQWQTFISMATDHMKRLHGAKYKSTVVPHILIEEKS
jgi:hypothetical protein